MGLLNKNVPLENGLIAQAVYYNILDFIGNKSNITFNVNAYASREAMIMGSPVLFQKSYAYPYPLNTDVINYGYEKLKLEVEFENAEDVFEEGQPDLE